MTALRSFFADWWRALVTWPLVLFVTTVLLLAGLGSFLPALELSHHAQQARTSAVLEPQGSSALSTLDQLARSAPSLLGLSKATFQSLSLIHI